ncbi:MAG: 5'-nucleotidase C-terminal domain-containing protein [Candidatus Eremiobacteraeota bacterium]|nr:5'-nucleotidase C-terminal domain-containing protein [Candidatus Eremiobacteraeota bacterium]
MITAHNLLPPVRPSGNSSLNAEKRTHLTILHINDLHGEVTEHAPAEEGKVGGIARIAGGIKELRSGNSEGTIVLDGGDFFEGSFYSKFSQGEIVGKSYEKIGFDAIALGNHDVTWGLGPGSAVMRGAGAAILSANMKPPVKESPAVDLIRPYTVIERKGLKIGILGLTCREAETATPGRGEIAFDDPVAAARNFVGELKGETDLMVVLSHLGYSDDVKLAKSVEGIDVIVGSHSHTALKEGEMVGSTLVTQAGEYGDYIGKIDLVIDGAEKTIVSHQASLVPVTENIPADNEVASIVASYLPKLDGIKDRVVGYAAEELENFRHGEGGANTNLTNLFIDSQRRDSDIALSSTFSLRKGIPRGPITFGDLYEAHPFKRSLLQVRAQGSQVLEFLEEGLMDKNRVNGKIFSGLTYEYCREKPEGSRIVSLSFRGRQYSHEEFSGLSLTVSMDAYIKEKKCFRDCRVTKSYGDVFEIFKGEIETLGTLRNLPSEVRYARVSDDAPSTAAA